MTAPNLTRRAPAAEATEEQTYSGATIPNLHRTSWYAAFLTRRRHRNQEILSWIVVAPVWSAQRKAE